MEYKEISKNAMPKLKSDQKWNPPEWALLERMLFQSMSQAAEEFTKRYTRQDGTLIWRDRWPGMDGSDDAYESFHNFVILYILGGSSKVYHIARKEWEAVTWQWTQYGQIYKEFDGYYDWMHHGESYIYFYYFGLADPAVLQDRQRAIRFASLYMGDDPEAPNYDPKKRLIRSPITGSRGPRLKWTAEDWQTHREVLDYYPPPFEDIPGAEGPTCHWSDDAVYARVLEKMNQRMAKGDVPLNLNATSLITHTYLYTGEERYKQWVLDYLEAWKERTQRNGGIIPDNIGLSGEIGEYMDGKWWGGYYGWRWPHGFATIIEPLINAGCNAALLTGDMSHLDLARSQMDRLWELGHESDGQWLVPNRHYDHGWGDYRPLSSSWLIYCWSFSQEEEDKERVGRLRQKDQWNKVTADISKGNRCDIAPWYNYIAGKNPDYPVQILKANYEAMCRRLESLRSDREDPNLIGVHHWQDHNPVVTEGLVQLIMGAPQHVYHGGLMYTPVRYYDAAEKRPGLPEDVGALVEAIDKDSVTLNLINMDTQGAKEIIIQGGCFGEHNFEKAEMLNHKNGDAEAVPVNGKWLAVELAPGAGIKLRLRTKRFANKPSYETPWISQKDYPVIIKSRCIENI